MFLISVNCFRKFQLEIKPNCCFRIQIEESPENWWRDLLFTNKFKFDAYGPRDDDWLYCPIVNRPLVTYVKIFILLFCISFNWQRCRLINIKHKHNDNLINIQSGYSISNLWTFRFIIVYLVSINSTHIHLGTHNIHMLDVDGKQNFAYRFGWCSLYRMDHTPTQSSQTIRFDMAWVSKIVNYLMWFQFIWFTNCWVSTLTRGLNQYCRRLKCTLVFFWNIKNTICTQQSLIQCVIANKLKRLVANDVCESTAVRVIVLTRIYRRKSTQNMCVLCRSNELRASSEKHSFMCI